MPNATPIDLLRRLLGSWILILRNQNRNQSNLGKSISVAEVGEKIINAPIILSIKEFLADSPEMSSYIHEQTRRRWIPVGESATASATEYDAHV